MRPYTYTIPDLSSFYLRETIDIKVQGFWSRDPISVYIDAGKGKIETRVTWSTGGREPEEVESDLEAAENFAQAILGAVELARSIEARADILMASHERMFKIESER